MTAEFPDALDYGGSTLSRIIRKVNAFRSTPTAILLVSTMAVFADTVVYGLIVPFLPDILQDKLGMSSSANGILFGCFGAGVLVGAPTSAYISDRWNIRKWPMIIGLLGLGLTSVLFAFANAFWELVLARLAQGVSSGITWAIGLGMIADVYAGEAIGKAMGVAFSGFTLGYLGGPVLGGAIYHSGGIHGIAIFVGAITAVDLVFRLILKEPKEVNTARQSRVDLTIDLVEPAQREKLLDSVENDASISPDLMNMTSSRTFPSKEQQQQNAAEPRSADIVQYPSNVYISENQQSSRSSEKNVNIVVSSTNDHTTALPSISEAPQTPSQRRTTMWDLLKEWPIIACCIATITITGASGSFEPTLPIYMHKEFNSKELVISAVFVALVVPNVVMGPVAGKIIDSERILAKTAPYGRFGFMIVGSIFSAITIACVGATKSIATLIVSLIFVGFTTGVAAVPILGTMGEHVHRMGGDAYAKVYALFNIAYSIGVIVIPTVLPPIMNAVGFAGTLGVVSGILVAGAIIIGIQPTMMLCKYGRKAYIGENARVFL